MDQIEAGAAQDLAEAGLALEAFARSGALVRTEIERLARTGETDLERLARRLADVLAELAASAIAGRVGGPDVGLRSGANVFLTLAGDRERASPSSLNKIAALAAAAVRRGGRFQ